MQRIQARFVRMRVLKRGRGQIRPLCIKAVKAERIRPVSRADIRELSRISCRQIVNRFDHNDRVDRIA